ncbi:hypothetical protein [Roseovarius salis]|uniref:hypothetical protein n=1 Tax=Roseovarius salis TaxID=3376063 RepID=UPI0037CA8643
MPQTGKPDICLWACWGVAALAGLLAFGELLPRLDVIAALMFCGGLAVLVATAVSRMICKDPGMARNLGLVMGLERDDSYKSGTEAAVSPGGPDSEQGDPARPAALPAPRHGRADDLTRIKGIGPALETLCHRHGIYHFDQIAAWSPREVAWMDSNLKGFRGRVTRDDWVGQARALMADAQTPGENRVMTGAGAARTKAAP